jgi:RecA/RadA recombinase
MVAARTGLLPLDATLGGGLPTGITEITGGPSTGKTALAGQIIAHNQRAGKVVGIVAAERIDPDYFYNLGITLEYLPVLPIWEIIPFLKTFKNSLVVVDSLSALQPDIDSDENWNEHALNLLTQINNALRPKGCLSPEVHPSSEHQEEHPGATSSVPRVGVVHGSWGPSDN